MKLLLLLLPAVVFGFPFQNSSVLDDHGERLCGGTIEKLWIELIFVVDISNGMGNSHLQKAGDSMKSIMQGVQFGLHSNPQTTRVGIITYNNGITLRGLNSFSSYNDFSDTVDYVVNQGTSQSGPVLGAALQEAKKMFGRDVVNSRKQFQKLVIVYGSKSSDNPSSPATDLKNNGIKIATVSVDSSSASQFGDIATTNWANNLSDDVLKYNLRNSLMTTNCFCPASWVQFRDKYGDDSSYGYGTCIHSDNAERTWIDAKGWCPALAKNGYMSNEYSKKKHNFIFNVVKANRDLNNYRYFIGLSYYNNNWYWEQPNGLNGRKMDYSDWASGYPQSSGVVVKNVPSNGNAQWENTNRDSDKAYFCCDVWTCDTDNYCDNSVV